jgi:transposase
MRKEPVVKKSIRFVGLDLHAETIAVAVAEADGEVRSFGVIPNRPEAVRRLVRKLGPAQGLRVCYEAGPCGYVLYWQLTQLGVHCDVIAPTLVPVKAGDRIKTDRRDALKLARSYRSGDLTAVWVPDEEHEALRDLVRAREAAKKDQLRARHRLHKFLLRRGLQPPEKIKTWTASHLDWVKTLRLQQPAQASTLLDYLTEVEHAVQRIKRLECAIDQAIEAAPASIRAVIDGLQALRGVARISAATLVAELGQLSRFPRPKQLMGYTGAVPREHSSGAQVRRGAITKTGNAHLRRILVEAAWSYRHRPCLRGELLRRQKNASEEVRGIAWKAQHRLHSRYARLAARGKLKQHIVTAIARELAGFVWAIGVEVERQIAGQSARAA